MMGKPKECCEGGAYDHTVSMCLKMTTYTKLNPHGDWRIHSRLDNPPPGMAACGTVQVDGQTYALFREKTPPRNWHTARGGLLQTVDAGMIAMVFERRALGSKGGKSTSPAKVRAARRNAERARASPGRLAYYARAALAERRRRLGRAAE